MIVRINRYIKNKLYYINEKKIGIKGIKFSHVTYCTVGNAGDNALSYFTRLIINREINSSWNIIPIDKKITENLVRHINSTDMLIIGGGGLFLPDTNKNETSGWQWAISNAQLQKITSPIVVFAVGYNYFSGQKNSDIFIRSINALIEHASFFSLRNHGSIRAIKEIVPPKFHSKIIYQPCITTIIRKIVPYLPPKKAGNNVAINMAFDRSERRYGFNKDSILKNVAKAVNQLNNKGYKIYYIAHCNGDLEFTSYLEQYCKNFEIINTNSWLPHKLIEMYNTMDVVLGMRGHAQMIPFGLNCEIISLGTHDKMKWFLEDIDALDWYIDLKDDTNLEDHIVKTFTLIHEKEYEKTHKRLIEQQDKLYDITMHNLSIIKQISEAI